jgi:hypothetical protein
MALSFRRIACIAIASLLPVVARAQESATITGHVTGEGGIALSGVAVSIPELGLGGITRDDGSFAVAVPSARVNRQAVTVTARRVGYKPKSARVTVNPGTLTQDFVLEANPLQLGEVVVTGAGTSTEVEKLGNVRNSVSPELIVKSNESNIVQALAGKAPNVQIAQSAGDPGAGSKITIRGLRTINGDVGRVHIDGVPMKTHVFDDELQSDRRRLHDGRRRTGRRRPARGNVGAEQDDGSESRRHRKCGNSQRSGGGGDLRRARGQRRHPRHDQARAIGSDALLAPKQRDQ